MTTCVVTGGAGFVGSHLCDHLLAKGYRVICIDNLDTGSLQNIEHIRSENFAFFNHDITEPVSYTHLRAHETPEHLVCRLLLEKKKTKKKKKTTN